MSQERRIRIDVAYKGTNYHGWQRQEKLNTVQGCLEAALQRIVGEQLSITGSSRTDTGVHALQQVAAFTSTTQIPAEAFARALNAYLPYDIRVYRSEEVPLTFHPIEHCVRKKYCYLIDDSPCASPFCRDYVWDYRCGRLDVDQMHLAAQSFCGTFDFASFQSQGSPRLSTERTIFNTRVSRSHQFEPFGLPASSMILIEVEGNGFLYHMVRTIAGTLVQVGNRSRSPDWISEIIAAKDRTAAGKTAPAAGLFLEKIEILVE